MNTDKRENFFMVSLLSLSLENLLAQCSPLIVENSFLVNPLFSPSLFKWKTACSSPTGPSQSLVCSTVIKFISWWQIMSPPFFLSGQKSPFISSIDHIYIPWDDLINTSTLYFLNRSLQTYFMATIWEGCFSHFIFVYNISF